MIFYAYLENKTDRQDDDVMKIQAKSVGEASRIARAYAEGSD